MTPCTVGESDVDSASDVLAEIVPDYHQAPRRRPTFAFANLTLTVVYLAQSYLQTLTNRSRRPVGTTSGTWDYDSKQCGLKR